MKQIHALFMSLWLLFANLLPKKEVKQEATPFLPMKLQFFADDPGGGDDPEPETGKGGENTEAFATFKTQEDLNKRLSRAEKKGQKELATSLGFDSVEAMQAALNKDKDKDKDKKKDDPVDIDAAVEAKLKEERDKTFKRLVNSEVKLMANELGFADWEDALALADLSKVKEDDKGNIVGVKEALEALKTKKPHLLKQQQSGRFGADIPNNQQRSKESLENIKKMAASRGTQQTTVNNPWA